MYKTIRLRLYIVLTLAFLMSFLFCFGQHASIDKKIDSLESRLASAKGDTQKIDLLVYLSELTEAIDSAKSLDYATRAVELSELSNWGKGIDDATSRLADYYNNHHDFSKAIELFEAYERKATTQNNKSRQNRAYSNLANIYWYKLGNYYKALDYYNKMLLVGLNDNEQIVTNANMGEIYKSLGDYTKALQSYEKAIRITDRLISNKKDTALLHVTQSALLISTAEIYIITNELDKAISNYKKALAVDNPAIICTAYQGIGKTYLLGKDYALSIENYKRALFSAKKSPEYGFEGVILLDLANAYLVQNNVNEAMLYAERSMAYAKKEKANALLGKVYTTTGNIYNATKTYGKAENYLNQAISIAKESGAKEDEKNAWMALSETYTAMHQPAKALDAYKQFITLRDSIYNADKAKELTRLDMQSEFDRTKTADSIREADEKKIAAFKLQRQRIMSYSGFAAVIIAVIVALLIYRNYSNSRKANRIISQANETIKEEKQVSENLLLNILPAHVADELKLKGNVDAKQFDNVTILFTDFVNFTIVSEKLTPAELVAELHTCFKAFDEIVSKYKIEKIKTVGDAYLAAAGLPDANPNHAADIVNAAIEIRDFMKSRKELLGDRTFGIRLGVNSGTVVAGIVGVKKFAYDIWGDAVNTAARMEQNSEHFKINISHSTYQIVKDTFACTYRGEIGAKNKGMLSMYFAERNN